MALLHQRYFRITAATAEDIFVIITVHLKDALEWKGTKVRHIQWSAFLNWNEKNSPHQKSQIPKIAFLKDLLAKANKK